jgi:dihydroorotate dehydrogenase (NAD+) catalytic subunit
MPYELFGKQISGRFTIPSGIVTTNVYTIKYIAEHVPEIGIITTKSIGKYPREGNREPIIHCYATGCPGTFINAVGLRNPGADKFAEELSRIKLPPDRFLLASIFGAMPDEMVYAAQKLEPYVDGFELNFSCPHSPGHGTAIGHDPKSIKIFTKAVREKTGKPVVAKLSPNTDHIDDLARAAMSAGANGLVAINTVGPKIYTIGEYPILTSPVGGSKSGERIKENRLESIRKIRDAVGYDFPMLIMGGISRANDVRAHLPKEKYFGVGTVLAGMSTKNLIKYFAALESDVINGTNEADRYLVLNRSGHKRFNVLRNERLAEDLSMVTLDGSFEIAPGQFAFAWIPSVGEKPYSLVENNPAKIAVQMRKRSDGTDGIFSTALVNVKEGSEIYLRGPCGNAVELEGIKSAVIVGGGTGTAAIYPIFSELREKGIDVKCFVGAKDKKHVVYADNFYGLASVSTDDGSYGSKGFVTDILAKRLKDSNIDANTVFFNCGPAPMLREAEAIELKYVSKNNIFSSEEKMVRCGYGLCGECARKDGLRTDVDGPFMNPI